MPVRQSTKMVARMDDLSLEFDVSNQVYHIGTHGEYFSLTRQELVRLHHMLHFMDPHGIGDETP